MQTEPLETGERQEDPSQQLSADELAQFERDGFIIVRQLAPAAVHQPLRALAERHLAGIVEPIEYEADTRYPGAPESRQALGGRTVRRLLQAYRRDPRLREWAGSPQLIEPLRQLLGPDLLLSQAHHNCVMTKNPAFSSVTGWHQDIRYWSFQRPELVSTWLALGPERKDNGCLLVVPESHRMEFDQSRYDTALFFRTDTDENRRALARQIAVELDAGDVLFFHARLLHAAGRNLTDLTKLAVVFTYHAADNLPLADTRSASLPEVALT